ncbi:MAG: MFS transporter [Dethiobacteraceae bacterium]
MSDQSAKTVSQEVTLTPYSWVVAGFCFLTWAASMLTRFAWSTSIGKAAPDLGISMVAAGGLMTAFYVGYVVGNFFSGFFVDSLGPRKVLAAASLLTGLFTLLIPFVSGYVPIFILRVLAGISAGPLFAGGTKMQLAWFPGKMRGLAMQFVMSGAALGTFIATAGLAPIIESQGWKPAFTYAGIASLIIGFLTLLFAKERGIALVRQDKSAAQKKSAEEKQEERKNLLELLKQKQFIVGSLIMLLNLGAGNGFSTWAIVYFTESHGFSLIQAGAILGGTRLLGLFSGPLSGFISDRLGNRKTCIYIGFMANFVCTMGLLLTKNVSMLWALMIARTFLASLGGNMNTLMAESFAGPYAGRVMGIYNMICQLGSVIFPVVLGLVLDVTGSFFAVMTTVACTFLVMALGVTQMKETLKTEVAKTA